VPVEAAAPAQGLDVLVRLAVDEALRSGRLSLEGPPQLTAAFTTWIRPSPYADVVPAREAHCPPAASMEVVYEKAPRETPDYPTNGVSES
jgi:hypothetical protein